MKRIETAAALRRLTMIAGLVAAQSAAKPQVDPALAPAQQAYLKLDDEDALAQARALLATQPDHAAARELEARCLLQMKRPAEALAALAKLASPSPAAQIVQADALAASGDGDGALVTVQNVLATHPRFLEAHLARVRALLARHDLPVASKTLEEMRQKDPSRPDFVPLAAALLEAARRLPDALKLHQSIVADPRRFATLDPHAIRDANEGIARVSFFLGRFDDALRGYGELARRWPHVAEYHYRLGLCQGMAKLPMDAIASLRTAVELDPSLHECRLRLAEMYRTKQMVPEAIAEFEQLHAVEATKRESARALAELWLKSGSVEKAAALTKEFEGLEPPTAQELEVAGLVHDKLGERDVAKGLYRRCLALDPLQFDVFYKLALLLLRSEVPAERDEGAAMMERYERIVPVLPDLEGAVAGFKLSAANPNAMIAIAGILNVGGEYELARQWVERAIKAAPNDALAQGIAGCIAANQKRDADALAAFERSVELGATASIRR